MSAPDKEIQRKVIQWLAYGDVSEDLRRASTRIPWKQIAGTRDRLVHGYFDVDLDIVWAIVSRDLPMLIGSMNIDQM